jgi:outer membrane protein OmpA-like peptidoglycan-associated protein
MKNFFVKKFLLLSLFFPMMATSQSVITGNWTGALYQNPSAGNVLTQYKFSMRLEEHNGVVTGVSTIVAGPNFGILDLNGVYKDGKVSFEEYVIEKEKRIENFDWCFKKGTLEVKKEGTQLQMTGNWTGYAIGNSIKRECSPGKIVLTKEEKGISLIGYFVNEKTNKPIPAQVKIVNKTTGKQEALLNSATGEFDIKLPGSNEYELTVESKGYLTKYEYVYLAASKILNITMTPIETGQLVHLKYILFEKGTSDLTKDSYPELDRLCKFLTANPSVTIELQGHTSNEGNAAKNVELSEQRVSTIKNFLVQKGINASRLKLKAFGAQKPIVANDTEENRKLNRRVEFLILNK